MERLVELAIADLSARLGVDSDVVAVVVAESVTWGDASLGCPQPGMRYKQVPQDGARIHLRAGGIVYRYHAGGPRTEPFLCRQGAAGRPAPSPPITGR